MPDPFEQPGGVPDLSDLESAFTDEDPPEPGTEPPAPSQPPAEQPPAPDPAQPAPPAPAPAPEQPTPPSQPPQPDLGVPPELSQPPAPPEPQPGEEQPQGPQPGEEGYLYAGRFQSPQDLEAGYLQARRLHENTARERNQQQIRAEQAIELARRLYPYYQQHIQGQQQPQQPGQPQPLPEGIDEETARTLQPWIDQRVQSQLGTFRQVLTQEQVQQQEAQRQEAEVRAEREAAGQAITAFESQVPLDEAGKLALADSFKELDLASKAFDGTPLAITLENLTVAHEASKSPALLRQLRVMPQLMDTEDGMAWAREQATLPPRAPSAPAPAGPSATPGPQAPSTRTSELRAARVEEGGPLPPGEERETPEDPWQEVLELHRSDGGRVSPILGV